MNDDHLPAEGQTCEICGADGHSWCVDSDLDLRWLGLFVDFHNVVVNEERRAA